MPPGADGQSEGKYAAAVGVEGEILSVDGADLVTYRTGDTGIVRGTQIARVRASGQAIEDRNSFLDVFVRREGRWVMALALAGLQPTLPLP